MRRLITIMLTALFVCQVYAADQRIHSNDKRGLFRDLFGDADSTRIVMDSTKVIFVKGDSLMFYDAATGDTLSLYELVTSTGGATSVLNITDDQGDPLGWDEADSLVLADNIYGTLTAVRRDSTFSLVLFPDTQLMIQNYPGIVDTMVQWVDSSAVDSNFVFATHVGDIVQSALSESEWQLADSFFATFDNSDFPYSVSEGNHDISGTYFDDYFGVERFDGKPSYGGVYHADTTRCTYHFFEYGINEFLIINSNYVETSTKLAWMDSLCKAYPEKHVIVNRHWMLHADNSWVVDSTLIDSLKDNSNFKLMVCGHRYAGGDGAAYKAVEADDGDSVRVILADYQFFPYNGAGWMRFLKFAPAVDSVYMTTYSPWLDSTMTTYPDQKTFFYDLDYAGDVVISFTPKLEFIKKIIADSLDGIPKLVFSNGAYIGQKGDSLMLYSVALLDTIALSEIVIKSFLLDTLGAQAHNPGGALNSVQYNNAGEFGGFGEWTGAYLRIPGDIRIPLGSRIATIGDTTIIKVSATASIFSGYRAGYYSYLPYSVFLGHESGYLTGGANGASGYGSFHAGYRSGYFLGYNSSDGGCYANTTIGYEAAIYCAESCTGIVREITAISQQSARYLGRYALHVYGITAIGSYAGNEFGRNTTGRISGVTLIGTGAGYNMCKNAATGHIDNVCGVGDYSLYEYSIGTAVSYVFGVGYGAGANKNEGSYKGFISGSFSKDIMTFDVADDSASVNGDLQIKEALWFGERNYTRSKSLWRYAGNLKLADANNDSVTVDSLQKSYNVIAVRKDAVTTTSTASKNDAFMLDLGFGIKIDIASSVEDSIVIESDTTVIATKLSVVDSITAYLAKYQTVQAIIRADSGSLAAIPNDNANGWHVWEFADNVDRVVRFNMRTPDQMDTTENSYIEIIWYCATTSEYAYWQLDYQPRGLGEDCDAAAGFTLNLTGESSGTSEGLTRTLFTIPSADVGTGDYIVQWELMRDGNSFFDTLNATVYVQSIGWRFITNGIGADG